MFFIENFNIVLLFIICIFSFLFFYGLYEGKNKINLKSLSDGKDTMSYSKDEKMFLSYAKLPLFKKYVPEKDTYEYKQAEDFLMASKKQVYRTVHIYYGAKIYYGFLGFIVGLLVGLFPIIFNLVNEFAKLELVPLNFPLFISLVLPLLGLMTYKYPEMIIKSESVKKKKKLHKEILSLGIVIHSMLETGNSPYQILEIVKEVKPEFKEDIEKTLNEYYIDTNKALTNLKKRINIIDFDMIADSLLYAHQSDNKYATEFLNDYLIRLEQAQKIIFQKSSKIRPYFLLGASTLPMIGALLIWFYPWLAEATKMLSSGFGI